MAFGYLIVVHASSAMEAIAAFTVGQAGAVKENHAPALVAATTFLNVAKAESPRTQTCPLLTAAAVVSARVKYQSALLPERTCPRRSEHSAITGAEVGVLMTARNAFRPRTPQYPYAAPCFL